MPSTILIVQLLMRTHGNSSVASVFAASLQGLTNSSGRLIRDFCDECARHKDAAQPLAQPDPQRHAAYWPHFILVLRHPAVAGQLAQTLGVIDDTHSCASRFFDASALVKVFTNEPASEVVRTYWQVRATKYTTPFCFYDAMNVLKSKWKHKGQLSIDEYLDAAFRLAAWYGASSAQVRDLDFADPLTFSETKKISERSALDLSDAFQILSVKRGCFPDLANDSATILVTADNGLAIAARLEGVRAWDVLLEPPPQ